MSKDLICSKEDIQVDSELSSLSSLSSSPSIIPFSVLDPNHRMVGEKLKRKILHDRYSQQLITDGIETGNLSLGPEGKVHMRTNLNFSSFLGLVLESYCVDEINKNKDVLLTNILRWATGTRFTKEKVKEYFAIGTGFKSTREQYQRYYNPQDNIDILFLRRLGEVNSYEPAVEKGTTNSSGVQIKAITTNLNEQIIQPLLDGKYNRVLTLLTYPNGKHTYDQCMDIIREKYNKGQMTIENYNRLQGAIISPSHIGLDQVTINNYVQYVYYWFHGQAPGNNSHLENAVGLEIQGFKMKNGILVPSDA
ncbi:hypothetical protein [Vibrio vulnificus]|uniref:hypothetical protein n=1 Tax=Vibrio vulnificus TaxID=672 RepID=UPI003133B512